MNITHDFLKKYDKSGPRYTSYPPATYFSDNFSYDNYIKALNNSNTEHPTAISLYIHIPFCDNKCHFCGCASTNDSDNTLINSYTATLLKEIKMLSKYLDCDRQVTQIHWGGGTPYTLTYPNIKNVIDSIYLNFNVHQDCEIAIECNLSGMDHTDIELLASIGFNRVSLGIQDLNMKVLDAVNRKPPRYSLEKYINEFRFHGFTGVNIDLIYGLPYQTAESFLETIKTIISYSPDRIVTFSYAHMPWVLSNQQNIDEKQLPSPKDKLKMLTNSYTTLKKANYISIGIDHYAKANDSLAKALKNRQLHRNFQGYCTRETTGQVYALGITGISQLESSYFQNYKDIDAYTQAIENNKLPIFKGYILSENEKICRTVINEIMCNRYLDFTQIADKFNKTVLEIKNILEFKPENLSLFIEDKLLYIDNETITISKKGAFILRNIAMVFDPKIKSDKTTYSRTV